MRLKPDAKVLLVKVKPYRRTTVHSNGGTHMLRFSFSDGTLRLFRGDTRLYTIRTDDVLHAGTGKREEGMAYAVFSFTRKLGQTLAGVGLNALLAFIAYDGELSKQGVGLSETVLSKLYDISTLVPAIMLALTAVLLFAGYDLSKKKLGIVRSDLAQRRAVEQTESA